MAKVTFIVPIDELHGKIRKGFGAAQRENSNNEGDRKPYTVFYGKRKSEPSDAEKASWQRWGLIGKKAALRNTDAAKKASDMTAFKAQSQYKTFKAYQWHQAEAEVDALVG